MYKKTSYHLWAIFATLGLAMAEEAMEVGIEPFVGAWCAKAFPKELPYYGGFDIIHLLDHKNNQHIEPFLGKWCFEQFPKEMAELDLLKTVEALPDNHIPIEPFLVQWGVNSISLSRTKSGILEEGVGADELVNVEPFIGQWCHEQFPEQLKDVDPGDLFTNHVDIEETIGGWCFAQFPMVLAAVDEPMAILGLGTSNHEKLENQLILWSLTTNNGILSPANSNSLTPQVICSSGGSNNGALIKVTIALVVALAALMYVSWLNWSSRQKKPVEITQPTITYSDNNAHQDSGEGALL